MNEGVGCLITLVVILAFWGAIAWFFIHPPGLEDIPWFVAGVSVAIILRAYKRERQD